jgi:hypothetical protein
MTLAKMMLLGDVGVGVGVVDVVAAGAVVAEVKEKH